MDQSEQAVAQRLLALRDPAYRRFQCRLMPTVDPAAVLGVRTPALRALARELYGTPLGAGFMAALPHASYDANNLHAFLICRIGDFDTALAAVEAFLPQVDNWATCDQLRPPALGKNLPALLARAQVWLGSGRTYTVRFGMGVLMTRFLGEAFDPAQPALVARAAARLPDYYVRMMAAWYFATALYKQWDAALPWLQQRRLDPWTHNKAIRKALESRRITAAQKALLRGLQV